MNRIDVSAYQKTFDRLASGLDQVAIHPNLGVRMGDLQEEGPLVKQGVLPYNTPYDWGRDPKKDAKREYVYLNDKVLGIYLEEPYVMAKKYGPELINYFMPLYELTHDQLHQGWLRTNMMCTLELADLHLTRPITNVDFDDFVSTVTRCVEYGRPDIFKLLMRRSIVKFSSKKIKGLHGRFMFVDSRKISLSAEVQGVTYIGREVLPEYLQEDVFFYDPAERGLSSSVKALDVRLLLRKADVSTYIKARKYGFADVELEKRITLIQRLWRARFRWSTHRLGRSGAYQDESRRKTVRRETRETLREYQLYFDETVDSRERYWGYRHATYFLRWNRTQRYRVLRRMALEHVSLDCTWSAYSNYVEGPVDLKGVTRDPETRLNEKAMFGVLKRLRAKKRQSQEEE
jgi:hypothetical protein